MVLARERASKARLVQEGIDFVLKSPEARARDSVLDLVGQAGKVADAVISRDHDVHGAREAVRLAALEPDSRPMGRPG